MKKFIFVVVASVIMAIGIYTSNIYFSNADNYISVSKVKENLGDTGYNKLISYYAAVGYEKAEVLAQIKLLNESLQKEIDEQTYLEKLNLYIYFNTSLSAEDNSNIIKSEVEYLVSLDDEQRADYKNVLEGILSYE